MSNLIKLHAAYAAAAQNLEAVKAESSRKGVNVAAIKAAAEVAHIDHLISFYSAEQKEKLLKKQQRLANLEKRRARRAAEAAKLAVSENADAVAEYDVKAMSTRINQRFALAGAMAHIITAGSNAVERKLDCVSIEAMVDLVDNGNEAAVPQLSHEEKRLIIDRFDHKTVKKPNDQTHYQVRMVDAASIDVIYRIARASRPVNSFEDWLNNHNIFKAEFDAWNEAGRPIFQAIGENGKPAVKPQIINLAGGNLAFKLLGVTENTFCNEQIVVKRDCLLKDCRAPISAYKSETGARIDVSLIRQMAEEEAGWLHQIDTAFDENGIQLLTADGEWETFSYVGQSAGQAKKGDCYCVNKAVVEANRMAFMSNVNVDVVRAKGVKAANYAQVNVYHCATVTDEKIMVPSSGIAVFKAKTLVVKGANHTITTDLRCKNGTYAAFNLGDGQINVDESIFKGAAQCRSAFVGDPVKAVVVGCKLCEYICKLVDEGLIDRYQVDAFGNTVDLLAVTCIVTTDTLKITAFESTADWLQRVGCKDTYGFSVMFKETDEMELRALTRQFLQLLGAEMTAEETTALLKSGLDEIDEFRTFDGALEMLRNTAADKGKLVNAFPEVITRPSFQNTLEDKNLELVTRLCYGKFKMPVYMKLMVCDPYAMIDFLFDNKDKSISEFTDDDGNVIGYTAEKPLGFLMAGEIISCLFGKDTLIWRYPVTGQKCFIMKSIDDDDPRLYWYEGIDAVIFNGNDAVVPAVDGDVDGDHCMLTAFELLVNIIRRTLEKYGTLPIFAETGKSDLRIYDLDNTHALADTLATVAENAYRFNSVGQWSTFAAVVFSMLNNNNDKRLNDCIFYMCRLATGIVQQAVDSTKLGVDVNKSALIDALRSLIKQLVGKYDKTAELWIADAIKCAAVALAWVMGDYKRKPYSERAVSAENDTKLYPVVNEDGTIATDEYGRIIKSQTKFHPFWDAEYWDAKTYAPLMRIEEMFDMKSRRGVRDIIDDFDDVTGAKLNSLLTGPVKISIGVADRMTHIMCGSKMAKYRSYAMTDAIEHPLFDVRRFYFHGPIKKFSVDLSGKLGEELLADLGEFSGDVDNEQLKILIAKCIKDPTRVGVADLFRVLVRTNAKFWERMTEAINEESDDADGDVDFNMARNAMNEDRNEKLRFLMRKFTGLSDCEIAGRLTGALATKTLIKNSAFIEDTLFGVYAKALMRNGFDNEAAK